MGFTFGKNKKRPCAVESALSRPGNLPGLQPDQNKTALSTDKVRWNAGQGLQKMHQRTAGESGSHQLGYPEGRPVPWMGRAFFHKFRLQAKTVSAVMEGNGHLPLRRAAESEQYASDSMV